MSIRQLAKLVGHDALYDMFAMGGITGDYTPERLFGSTGRRLAEGIRAHNDAQATAFYGQIREWQAGNDA